MTQDEIERLATALAPKLQNAVIESVYRDAGKNLIGFIKQAAWAVVIAVAAWGAAKYGTNGG